MLFRSTGGTGCPTCGAAHAACGVSGPVTPVDVPMRKEPSVGPTRKYHVRHNGHDTVMRLNERDVAMYPGARPVDDDQAETTETTEQSDHAEASRKGRTPANKARRSGGDKSGA